MKISERKETVHVIELSTSEINKLRSEFREMKAALGYIPFQFDSHLGKFYSLISGVLP